MSGFSNKLQIFLSSYNVRVYVSVKWSKHILWVLCIHNCLLRTQIFKPLWVTGNKFVNFLHSWIIFFCCSSHQIEIKLTKKRYAKPKTKWSIKRPNCHNFFSAPKTFSLLPILIFIAVYTQDQFAVFVSFYLTIFSLLWSSLSRTAVINIQTMNALSSDTIHNLSSISHVNSNSSHELKINSWNCARTRRSE